MHSCNNKKFAKSTINCRHHAGRRQCLGALFDRNTVNYVHSVPSRWRPPPTLKLMKMTFERETSWQKHLKVVTPVTKVGDTGESRVTRGRTINSQKRQCSLASSFQRPSGSAQSTAELDQQTSCTDRQPGSVCHKSATHRRQRRSKLIPRSTSCSQIARPRFDDVDVVNILREMLPS